MASKGRLMLPYSETLLFTFVVADFGVLLQEAVTPPRLLSSRGYLYLEIASVSLSCEGVVRRSSMTIASQINTFSFQEKR